MWVIDTSGFSILLSICALALMVFWIYKSIVKGMATSEAAGEDYDLITDWRSIKRIGISILIIILWFAVMPVRQELNDGMTKSTLRTEFNKVAEEDRIRVEDTLTREVRESRLEDLRIQNQVIAEDVRREYEELQSQNDTTEKGDN